MKWVSSCHRLTSQLPGTALCFLWSKWVSIFNHLLWELFSGGTCLKMDGTRIWEITVLAVLWSYHNHQCFGLHISWKRNSTDVSQTLWVICSQNAWPLVFGDSRYSICWLRCSCSFPSLDLRLILLSYSLKAGYIHYLFEVHFSGCEHDATFATLVKYFCLYVWLQGFRITRQIDYFVITVKTQPKSSSEVAVAWTQCLIIREYLTPTW